MTKFINSMHIRMNGVQRLCGPPLGAGLTGLLNRREILVVGGLLILISAYLAWRQAEAEKVQGRYPTFTDQEAAELVLDR